MKTGRSAQRRPYWHVDAKWVTGLTLVGVLSLTVVLFSLVRLTALQPAVDIAGSLLAARFSPLGLDDETEIAALRSALQANPDQRIGPVSGLQVSIRADEIQNLDPREVRLYVYRQVAEPFYWLGETALAGAAEPAHPEEASLWISTLRLFTAETHQRLLRALVAFAAACVVLLILLVTFSDRLGRVGSPGVALFASALPGVAISSLYGARAPTLVQTAPPPAGAGSMATAGYLLTTILPRVMPSLTHTYLVVLAIGLGLMSLAVLGNLASWLGSGSGQGGQE